MRAQVTGALALRHCDTVHPNCLRNQKANALLPENPSGSAMVHSLLPLSFRGMSGKPNAGREIEGG